jgi:hypothetical protein
LVQYNPPSLGSERPVENRKAEENMTRNRAVPTIFIVGLFLLSALPGVVEADAREVSFLSDFDYYLDDGAKAKDYSSDGYSDSACISLKSGGYVGLKLDAFREVSVDFWCKLRADHAYTQVRIFDEHNPQNSVVLLVYVRSKYNTRLRIDDQYGEESQKVEERSFDSGAQSREEWAHITLVIRETTNGIGGTSDLLIEAAINGLEELSGILSNANGIYGGLRGFNTIEFTSRESESIYIFLDDITINTEDIDENVLEKLNIGVPFLTNGYEVDPQSSMAFVAVLVIVVGFLFYSDIFPKKSGQRRRRA